MNIFPFEMSGTAGRQLFGGYVVEHLDELHQLYGRHWSWYDVDVTVLSPTKVKFTTYDMADPVYGGCGQRQDEITHELNGKFLATAIEQRKQHLAAQAWREAQRDEAARIEREGIAAVYKELFGEKP